MDYLNTAHRMWDSATDLLALEFNGPSRTVFGINGYACSVVLMVTNEEVREALLCSEKG